ncbi:MULTISPECIES: hypothetical protein [unclassified Lysinibacillus]|uniref:hypothetical protein n=1 Tax=unclassified Lysinibacillus TaxID=2636778 RepID=UPI0025565617|nr:MULTISPECIES: hypothetical protein [unclassified Lysinibacillus]MDM5249145.1 hypothetical protein [Lysinibacillus sp. G4S2]
MSINKLIENFECPLINAFFFSNEDILVLDNNNEWIRVLCKSTIESFFKYNDGDSVCHFDILKKYETDDFTVSIGEGSFGGDGIVQLNDKTGKLIWFLFLDNSNPFIKAELENDSIQVTSTKGIKIKIPIHNPEKISIVK